MLAIVLLAVIVGCLVVPFAIAWVKAGPCDGPRCRGRASYQYKDGRQMCGDCCWLADMDCLDLDKPPRLEIVP